VEATRDVCTPKNEERGSSQAEVLRQQEHFCKMVQAVQDYAILLLDKEGYVISWNAGAARIKGYSAEEIIGKHVSCFYPQDAIDRNWPEFELQQAAIEGRFEDEGWRVRKGGKRFWANVVITSWQDDGGQLRGFLKITRDLTSRREAEQQLVKYTERLKRSNQDLEQFASVAAHDLQEPLRKIQTYSDRLNGRPGLDDQSQDYVSRILNSAGRMRDLINDLLTFSRVSSDDRPFVMTDLSIIAREVVSDLEGRIQQSHGSVEVGSLPELKADPGQMRQLLMNLIGNGLKFGRPEEPPVVRVNAASSDSTYEIRVEDNGIGFEEIYLDRIFELFQRLHGRHEYEGTGIGLAIVRKIVERHHGTITAKSVLGKGSTFIVTLPVEQEEESE
jgi:PAS domain S-box-containing protein